MEKHIFQLGDKVIDLLTGTVGILSSRSLDMNGMQQFAIQPNVNEKGESIFVDTAQLQLEEAQVIKFTPVPKDVPDLMGSKVRNIVSGFTGIATERIDYLNGCVRFCVQGEVSRENPKGLFQYVNYQQLEVVRRNVLPAETEPKPNGGPSRKASEALCLDSKTLQGGAVW